MVGLNCTRDEPVYWNSYLQTNNNTSHLPTTINPPVDEATLPPDRAVYSVNMCDDIDILNI